MRGEVVRRQPLLDCCFSLPGGTQIFVQVVDGPRLTFDVLYENTILEVKTIVSNKIGKQASSFELLYGTRRLLDHETLNDCGVRREAILSLVHKVSQITVFLSTGKINISIRIASNASVADLKAAVREKARLSERFLLVFDGISLTDEGKRLDEINVTDGATFYITYMVDGAF